MLRLITFLAAVLLTIAMIATSRGADPNNAAAPVQEGYIPERSVIEALRKIERPVTVVIFHGDWCPDCRREVPRFKKILEAAANPQFTVVEYQVNPQKQDVLGKFRDYQIQKVPTFIFLDGERELGRIVETPKENLEKDFLTIVGRPT